MMKKFLLLLLFSSLQAETIHLTEKDIKKCLYKEIKVAVDPYPPEPYIANETVDWFGKKYKRVVFSGPYSKSRERQNLGGGALFYYLTSFLSIKTGPSYTKGVGLDKHWKWSLELRCEIATQ